ncbi:MAG: SMP-30/gluconolactonase/LRE family protein [Singulisphaera sp.]
MSKTRFAKLTSSAALMVLLGAAAALAAADEIVPAGAKLELLYTRSAPIKGGLTEGPAVAPDGSIYFTDIPEGKDRGLIVRYDPATQKTSVFSDDSGKANGLAFDAQGRLIACEGSDEGGRRVSMWDVKTGKRTTLVDRFAGKHFNAPNDLTIDEKGRIYFTDPRYLGTEPRELDARAVYRLNPDGSVVELTRDVEKPNGIAISPDQTTLYVADTNNGSDRIMPDGPKPKKGAMKVYAFPLDNSGAISGPRRTIIDFGSEDGCDGMSVDARGNLYLTARSAKRPGVLVLNPQGKELAYIATGPSQPDAQQPTGLPSNCEFGIGPDARTMYITVDKSLYRIGLNVEGYHIPWAN